MGLHDLIHDGQAESGAAFEIRLERLEDFFDLLRSHPGAGIGKADLPVVAQRFDGNGQRPPPFMARTAFSQKFQNTCLILSPSAMA